MDAFKEPHTIPQDILLIQDIVGVQEQVPRSQAKSLSAGEDIGSSSDSVVTSEEEIQAELFDVRNDDGKSSQLTTSSESESDESDSDSPTKPSGGVSDLEYEEHDEESSLAPHTGAYFLTKNEVPEGEIHVPDIQAIGPEEKLEKVGEIMSVVGSVAIVKGSPSDSVKVGPERALDSDTLLVFEDRSVMGYVYETFGPTSQPFYQVKFNSSFPLDPGRIRPSRDVFHVPERSVYVFLRQIQSIKGSDASNFNDEEPAEHELEFSDDEVEAIFKKKKRMESRSRSVPSSRQPTPTPSQMFDQDLNDEVFYSRNPYDEHSPYDLGLVSQRSRPPPLRYDDPYGDDYPEVTVEPQTETKHAEEDYSSKLKNTTERARGRRRHVRGRNRGWSSGHTERGTSYGKPKASDDLHGGAVDSSWSSELSSLRPSFKPRISRPRSSTTPATSQTMMQVPDFVPQHQQLSQWIQFPNVAPRQLFLQPGPYGYQQTFVQPHINPRFAATFAMNMDIPRTQHANFQDQTEERR